MKKPFFVYQPAFLIFLVALFTLIFTWPFIAEGFSSIRAQFYFLYVFWLLAILCLFALSRFFDSEQQTSDKDKPLV